MSSMVVKGLSILANIARKPDDFCFSDAQVNDLVMSILVAKTKEKELKVEQLRKIAIAIGDSDFKLVLEHIPTKELTGLIKRIDGKNPGLKTADEAWNRNRATALIIGGEEPKLPEPKAKAPMRSVGSKTGKALQSKALKPRASKKSAAT